MSLSAMFSYVSLSMIKTKLTNTNIFYLGGFKFGFLKSCLEKPLHRFTRYAMNMKYPEQCM